MKIAGTLDGDVVRQKTDLIGLTSGSLDETPIPEEVVQQLVVPAVNFWLSGWESPHPFLISPSFRSVPAQVLSRVSRINHSVGEVL